ncbi:MAG: 16S rRNA (cytosine(1402)-N(4))-methyltransferase RsmH [Candidatus Eisenbacteria bacterium]
MADLHVPVMVDEVLEHLVDREDGVYADVTTGTGGHAQAILERIGPNGRLICLDQDPVALEIARGRLGNEDARVRFQRGNYAKLDEVLAREGLSGFDGVLADIGLNSYTLARPEAGMSYQQDVPLDMAVDPDIPLDAAEYLQSVDEAALAQVFQEFGDLRRARLYARRIVERRRAEPIRTTGDLVRTVRDRDRQVDAGELSRIFQAIRVVVLDEMPRLEGLLDGIGDWLQPAGRFVIISYAGHEEKRLKRWMKSVTSPEGPFEALTRRPIGPTREEVGKNRRARSARLRAVRKRGEG